MFNRVLMVCVGNVCRSPMAEALLRTHLRFRFPGLVVQSAGLSALVGEGADPIAVELMAARGIDLGGHRARQITSQLVRDFELVVVMEADHQKAIESMVPSARGKVQRLGRFGSFDVPDPYRRGREAFEAALGFIDRGLKDFEDKFWSRA